MLSLPNYSGETLSWTSSGDSTLNDEIELWFKAADILRFKLIDPQGFDSPWIHPGEKQLSKFPRGNEFYMQYIKYSPDNGHSRLQLIIGPGDRSAVLGGTWNLRIEAVHVKTRDRVVHAWIERKVNHPIRFTNFVSEDYTLS